jgi:protein arginine kinase activator
VIGSSKVVELHICDDCAKKMLDYRRQMTQFGVKPQTDWLSSVIDNTTIVEPQENISCPSCGKKFEAFSLASYKGCPSCYIAFKETLGKILGEFALAKETVESLKEDLERAICEERFEDAAKIRDYLKSLSRKTKNISSSD